MEGGIFSENSHQVRDLLAIITDHDRLRVENNKKNDETNRMSEIIVSLIRLTNNPLINSI